jgi:hypothetical protein
LAKKHHISDESDEEEESVSDTKSPPVPRPTFKKNRHVIAESDEEVEVAQSHTVQHDEDMMITKSPTVSKINGRYPSIKRISASRQSGKKCQHHIKNDSPSEESPNKKKKNTTIKMLSKDVDSISSGLHGHRSRTSICEALRAKHLAKFLNNKP